MEKIKIEPSDILPAPKPAKPVDSNKDAFAIIGFVFSLLGLLGLISPNCKLFTILAIVFSVIGLKSNKKKLAIWGIVLAVIVFIVDIFVAIIFVKNINKKIPLVQIRG